MQAILNAFSSTILIRTVSADAIHAGLCRQWRSQYRCAASRSVDEQRGGFREQTLQAMRDVHQQYGYVLDPHTAVGYYAAKNREQNNEASSAGGTVVVGTAHPANFQRPLSKHGVLPTHPTLQALDGLPMRRQSLPCDIDAVKAYLVESLAGRG